MTGMAKRKTRIYLDTPAPKRTPTLRELTQHYQDKLMVSYTAGQEDIAKVLELPDDLQKTPQMIAKLKGLRGAAKVYADKIVALDGVLATIASIIPPLKPTDTPVDITEVCKVLAMEENRKKENRALSLMRDAVIKEKKRLTTPHTYMDGVEDFPLLIPELFEGQHGNS
jgi:hypothetical protein